MKYWGTSVSGISQSQRAGDRTSQRGSFPNPSRSMAQATTAKGTDQPAEEPEEPEVGEDRCLDQVERLVAGTQAEAF